MQLIVEKWSIPQRAWLNHAYREVPVKVTAKRIEITEGMNKGLRFAKDGKCVSRIELSSMYRYRLNVSGSAVESMSGKS